MSNIFITGGTGFVGSHLVNTLNDEGHHLVVYSRNRTTGCFGNVHFTNRLPSSFEDFDIVYHIAGVLGKKGTPTSDYTAAHINLPMTILKMCNEKQKQVYLSTAYVTLPDKCSHRDYIDTKIAGETLLKLQSPGSLMIVRPGPIFGPGDKHHFPLFKQVRRLGQLFPVMGGKNKICPTYVTDVISCMLPDQIQEGTFVVASEPTTIKDFLEDIALGVRSGTPFIPFPTIIKRDFFGVERVFKSDIPVRVSPSSVAIQSAAWYAQQGWL